MGGGVPQRFPWEAVLTACVLLMASGTRAIYGKRPSPGEVKVICPFSDVLQTKQAVQIKAYPETGNTYTVISCHWGEDDLTKHDCDSPCNSSLVALHKNYLEVTMPKSQLYKSRTFRCELVPTDANEPTTRCIAFDPDDAEDQSDDISIVTIPSDGDQSKKVSSDDAKDQSDDIHIVTPPCDGDQSKEVSSETAGHDNGRLLIVSIVLSVGLISSLFVNFFLFYQMRRRVTNKWQDNAAFANCCHQESSKKAQAIFDNGSNTLHPECESRHDSEWWRFMCCRVSRRPGDESASQSQMSLPTPVSTQNEGPDSEHSDRRPGDEPVSQTQLSLHTHVSTQNEGSDSGCSDRRAFSQNSSHFKKNGGEACSQSLQPLLTPVMATTEREQADRGFNRGRRASSQNSLHCRKQDFEPHSQFQQPMLTPV